MSARLAGRDEGTRVVTDAEGRAVFAALAPGTYEFRDLSYFSGLRNVEIVLRDRAGNTESLRLPVYFTGENLRAGLHEFRYAAGSPRDSFEGNGSYAGRAISGRHRYGVTDDLTVGASVEVIPGYRSAGVGAIVLSLIHI